MTISPVPKPSSAHSDLQRDLCRWLEQGPHEKWIAFKELDMDLRGRDPNTQRADVWALRWREPLRIHVYECKVSRADFLSDINSGKWEGYGCHYFYFVTPKGLLTLDDIPDGVGWVEQTKGGFRVRRTGHHNKIYHPSEGLLLACIKKQATYGG